MLVEDAPQAPLLGVAGRWGAAEVALARSFDDLHQMIYTRGGIRPSNAAVEEVAKLILIRLWNVRHASELFADLFTHTSAPRFRAAFASALASPSLMAVDPAGRAHPVWPLDEPFRLTDDDVLAATASLVATIVGQGRPTVSDPLGTAFDALLAGRYDHAGGLGTYLTPSGVARMMSEVAVDLMAQEPPESLADGESLSDGESLVDGESVADGESLPGRGVLAGAPGFGDPCCGTGRFLVAMLEVLNERVHTSDRASASAARSLLAAGPFGADQSVSSVAKARINMLLYGVERPLVWTVSDSVTDADLGALHGRIPLILTNPPFGEGKYDSAAGIELAAMAMPRLTGKARIDPALACLALCVRLLAPGGVLGIVLPDGVIASRAFADLIGGADDALVGTPDRVRLVANISLPTSTFALSGTVAKTSAVFLRKQRRTRHVVLARVEHVGYLRQAGRAAPDPEGSQLPTLAPLIRAGLANMSAETLSIANDDPLVALVAADSAQDLDPARLDPTAMRARLWLSERGGIELRELLTPGASRHARSARAPFVSVLHIDELGTVDWPAVATHAPSTPGIMASDGDIIISLLNPSRLRAAVIPVGRGPLQISNEFGVFTSTCDPYAIIGILYSERVRAQLRPLGTGTSSSRRRIGADDVLALVVPKLTADALDALGRSVREAGDLVTLGRERLRAQFDQLS